MAYFDSFMSIIKSPREVYKQQQQEVINNLFENAPTYYEDVKEEDNFGTLTFHKINVRVNNLVDAKTGQRVNDDFKKLIFEDVNYMPPLGTRYYFNNNIWIVFSTDNVKTDTSSVYVRRCNNTLNTQDEYGNIHQEPCYIDYSLTETQIFKEYSIDIARGRIEVGCQLNQYTKSININDRFIFGDDAYKVRIRTKFDRRSTFDNNTNMFLKLQLDYDNIAEDDNLEFQIANYKKYNYVFETETEITGIINNTGKISPKILLNGTVMNDLNVVWHTTNENIIIINKSSGEYKMVGLGECEIVCTLLENSSVSHSIPIKVVEQPEHDIVYNKILPNISYIKLNSQQEYVVNEYINNNITDTEFDIKFYNVPKRNYSVLVDGNKFVIKNLRTTEEPLCVTCTNLRDNSTIEFYVELGGLF